MCWSLLVSCLPGWLAAIAVLCQPAQSVWASNSDEPAVWTSPAGRPHTSPATDLELTLILRSTLEQDDKLADQKLTASVKDRVATLWGSVASADLSQHAVRIARQTIGVVSVINQLRIVGTAEAIPHGTQSPTPLTEPIVPEMPPSQKAVANRPNEQSLWNSEGRLWQPMTASGTPDSRIGSRNLERGPSQVLASEPMWQPNVTKNQVSPNNTPASSLPSRLPYSDSVVFGSCLHAQEELRTRVEAVCLGDAHFMTLRAVVTGETVCFRGRARTWMYVFDLCHQVAQIPGVRRIILEEIRVGD
jgi:hypothetical protein